jgi:hypothetical protein
METKHGTVSRGRRRRPRTGVVEEFRRISGTRPDCSCWSWLRHASRRTR